MPKFDLKQEDVKTKVSPPEFGILVVGAGIISQPYLEYFDRDDFTRLVAVAEPVKELREKVLQKYELRWAVSDYKDVLDSDEIDIVIVCTPHYLHYPIVMDALKAGKHVFCEKPISVSVREADEMLDMASSCNRKLYVMLNMRFDSRHATLAKFINRKKIGTPFLARFAYLGYEVERLKDPNNWKGDIVKAGGGVLLDGGYHLVDLMNGFFGPAKTVQALAGKYVVKLNNKGEDNIVLLIEYESGVIGELSVSFTTCNVTCDKNPTLILKMDILGTEGTIHSGFDSGIMESHFELITPQNREMIDCNHESQVPEKHEHFLTCLRNNTMPLVSALDARNAMAVVEAAYQSVRTGRKVEVAWRSPEVR